MGDIYKELDEAANAVSDLPDSHRETGETPEDAQEDDAAELEAEDIEEESDAEDAGLEGEDEESESGEELEPDEEEDEPTDEGEAPDPGNIEQLMSGLDPEDPKQNAIRSALGRMASTQRSVEMLTQQVEALTHAQNTQPAPGTPAALDDDDDEEAFIDTPKDVDRRIERYLQKKAARERQENKNYTNGFLNSFLDYSQSNGLSQEEQGEIWSEIYDNPKYGKETGDPVVDCKLNVTKARTVILERRLEAAKQEAEKKLPNVRGGGKPKVPLGSAPSSKRQESKPSGKRVKLDPEAEAFIRSRGISEDKAFEILSGETPVQFSR